MDEQKLIISLIKDDLINFKLVNGLNKLGLNAGMYFTHSCDTVFKLMGFENEKYNEELFEHYIELSKKVINIDISESNEPLNELCIEIYTELVSFQVNNM
ncbi:MAG: hypothetical protein HYR91_01615 [Flavobacteriia bacterium]|nr:hypothetical protein [Flavobacteriia bacterium]